MRAHTEPLEMAEADERKSAAVREREKNIFLNECECDCELFSERKERIDDQWDGFK